MSKASDARRNALYEIILNEGRVRVGDLARALDVTTETIRKDLKVLEDRGVLIKKHGSATVRNAYYQLPCETAGKYTAETMDCAQGIRFYTG